MAEALQSADCKVDIFLNFIDDPMKGCMEASGFFHNDSHLLPNPLYYNIVWSQPTAGWRKLHDETMAYITPIKSSRRTVYPSSIKDPPHISDSWGGSPYLSNRRPGIRHHMIPKQRDLRCSGGYTGRQYSSLS